MTWFLNQVMDHEAELQSGAERYVRGNGRRAHRNGHRERTLKTMAKKHWPEVSYEMKATMSSPESVPAFRERLLSLFTTGFH